MQDAIEALNVKPEYILTDAMPLKKFQDIPQEALPVSSFLLRQCPL